MQSKFSLYDLVGYIIPSIFLYFLLYEIAFYYLDITFSFSIATIGESLYYVLTLYLIGHFIQSLGKIIEKIPFLSLGEYPSEIILREKDEYYTKQFKEKILTSLSTRFNLSFEDPETIENVKKEAFNLSYSLIVQNNINKHAQLFNALFSFYRGLLTAGLIGILANLMTAFGFIILYKFETNLFSTNIFLLNLGTIGVLLLLHFLLKSRLMSFSYRFADSVYRSFYVWHLTQND